MRFGQKGDPPLGSCPPGGAAIDEIPPDVDQVVGTIFEQNCDQSRRLVTILRRLQLTARILATLLRNDEFVPIPDPDRAENRETTGAAMGTKGAQVCQATAVGSAQGDKRSTA